jgi:putative nucleotidyltransferase with HDIG domain
MSASEQPPEADGAAVRGSTPAPAVQLATLVELGPQIAGARTVEDVLRVVSRGARWLLTFSHCTLALETSDGDHYRIYAWETATGRFKSTTPMRRNHGLVGSVLTHQHPLRIADLDENGTPCDGVAEAFGPEARSALLLPLTLEERVFGTLNFGAARLNAYPAEVLSIGSLLALQVAGAVRNALLLEDLDGQETVILSLALAIEAKDPYTQGHCRRLAQYAERLGRVLALEPAHLTRLRMAAILHDVGKIAVPEAILNKPGALTPAEFAVVQQHPVVGENICRPLRSAQALLPAIRSHHERWDGQGYPDRLVAGAIPFDARITAIVDAFDAMTSDRPYRPGMPRARALDIMRANAGPQWDPDLVETFVRLIEADDAGPVA